MPPSASICWPRVARAFSHDVGQRNPATPAHGWAPDTTFPAAHSVFARGFSTALGLLPTNIHLIGIPGRTAGGVPPRHRPPGARCVVAPDDGTRISLSIGLVGVASVSSGRLPGRAVGLCRRVRRPRDSAHHRLLQSLPTVPMWLALSAAVPRGGRPCGSISPSPPSFRRRLTSLGRQVRRRFLSLRRRTLSSPRDCSAVAGCASSFNTWSLMTSHIVAVTTLSHPGMILNDGALVPGPGLRPPVISWGAVGGPEHSRWPTPPAAGSGPRHPDRAGLEPRGRRSA